VSYDRSYAGPPWTLHCAHCDWSIIVHNRGASGSYPGAGVEAAQMMKDHVARLHVYEDMRGEVRIGRDTDDPYGA
jgi:hypothetical protein